MEKTEDEKKHDTDFYLIFISLVFAVFLSVWIVPIGEMFDIPEEDPEAVLNAFLSVRNIQGVVMFAILVSLWWWYGKFLGQIDPATGFVMFGYDFVSLGSFAIAFRVWPHQIVLPAAICFAALLMLIRFAFSNGFLKRQNYSRECPARRAIRAANIILGFLIGASAFSVLFAAYLVLGTIDPSLYTKFWSAINWIVTALLVVGVGVTIYAAKITEGFEFFAPHTWRNPRPAGEWLKENPGRENEPLDDPSSA